jgi:serine/threonine protein kinase
MTERNTLLELRGDDFILQLRACFHDSMNYYLVTEYHPAGDLHTLLLSKGSPRNVVRFYMAELLIAIERTHAKRIVHRDIKPENLFIDNDGHIVLGDFGIARKLRLGENTLPRDDMFGTPAYTAPEMFTGEPYGREVDLWAFGVMLYELLTGNEAFNSNTVPQNDPAWLPHLARNIVYDEPEDSPFLTPDAADLIRKVSVVVGYNLIPLLYFVQLLRKSSNTRLLNFSEIKRHTFFEGLNWKALSNRSLTPPWIPSIGPGNVLGPEYPTFTPGVPYDPKCDPDQDFSFCFSPVALTPACQRHQRLFNSLGCSLPTVVNWVEGGVPTLELHSASSCTSLESYVEIGDAGGRHPVALYGPPVDRMNLRPLRRWAMCLFGRRTDVTRFPS